MRSPRWLEEEAREQIGAKRPLLRGIIKKSHHCARHKCDESVINYFCAAECEEVKFIDDRMCVRRARAAPVCESPNERRVLPAQTQGEDGVCVCVCSEGRRNTAAAAAVMATDGENKCNNRPRTTHTHTTMS